MTIDDLTSMDLTPLVVIFSIAAIIFLIYRHFTCSRAKDEYKSIDEKIEYGVIVISKELGDPVNIGGTIASPIKGYRCTFVFEKQDGSRLILKTSNAGIYEGLILGDIGDVKYKNSVLTAFHKFKGI